MTSVLIVEDHKILGLGIQAFIRDQKSDLTVVGLIGSGMEAVRFCRDQTPDVVITDLGLPDLGGVDVIKEVLRFAPKCQVIVLSAYSDDLSVIGAIQAGARGYVLKKASLDDVIVAIRTVARGGTFFSPEVADVMLRRVRKGETHASPDPLEGLSPREVQVLRLVASGHSSKGIAETLCLGVQTVHKYRKSMQKKLGVNSVAGVTQAAAAAGLIEVGWSRMAAAGGAD